MGTHTGLSEPSTSPSLLGRACAGDPEGWRRLVQLYGPIVYGWARRTGCQSADAADVMQETFVAITKALPGFDYLRPEATFRGWLWTITRNKIRDRHRNADRHGAVDGAGGTAAQLAMEAIQSAKDSQLSGDSAGPESENPPTESAKDSAVVRTRMLEILRTQFDSRVWKMFWETAVEGRLPADVADDLGVSKWAVYKARARVLNRLKTELEGLE